MVADRKSHAFQWLHAKAEHERAERLAEELWRRRGNSEDVRAQMEREAKTGVKRSSHMWKLTLNFTVLEALPEADHWLQAKAEHERAERLAEELRRRRGNREDVRAQLEREAEAGIKLQLQQRDLEWRQKYQVRHLCRDVPGAYTAFDVTDGKRFHCEGETTHEDFRQYHNASTRKVACIHVNSARSLNVVIVF